jgi:hypothetical protein
MPRKGGRHAPENAQCDRKSRKPRPRALQQPLRKPRTPFRLLGRQDHEEVTGDVAREAEEPSTDRRHAMVLRDEALVQGVARLSRH